MTPCPRLDGHFRWLQMVLLALALSACTTSEEQGVEKAQPGPVPEAVQRDGDPGLGYQYLLDGAYVSCGIPYSAWRRAVRPAEPSLTLEDRRGLNAQMPYYLNVHENDAGVPIVTTNCLWCHGGLFDGRLIIGLGNEALDFTRDPRDAIDTVGAYVAGKKEAAAWRKWAQRITAIAPYMITDTVGVNPAPNLTLALMAHRNPRDLTWSQSPRITPPPTRPLPLSVPPWWRMSKKHAMFYNAMGRGDHARYMMMKSLVCTDSVAEAEAIDKMFVHVRAYIASLTAPRYPFAIDASLARQGKRVFEQHCAACHGRYGTDTYYPNLVVDLATIGTDALYAQQGYTASDRFMNWFNSSWYGAIAKVRPALGYIAPPLDGVWATAPFLHNGSVPSIALLLDSRKRPTYWVRELDSDAFDSVTLGWRYEALPRGKDAEVDPRRRARIYDTTLSGYSNKGHNFGDRLTEAQRYAVIEYLKTL